MLKRDKPCSWQRPLKDRYDHLEYWYDQWKHKPHPLNKDDQHDYGSIYQKAYLAFQMIKNICEANDQDFIDPNQSLRDSLIQRLENQYLKVSLQSKQDILKLFKEGVQIDEELYVEDRINLGKSQSGKVIFFPTRLVTTEIFNKLQIVTAQKIIMGYEGISKTFSIILYQKLIDYIVDFVIEKLTKIGERNFRVIPTYYRMFRKIFYWKIQPEESKEKVKWILFQQVTQIQRIHMQKKQITKYQVGRMRYFYSKFRMSVQLVMDQINTVASLIRKTEYKKKMYQDYQLAYKEVNRDILEECQDSDPHKETIRRSIEKDQQRNKMVNEIIHFQTIMNWVLSDFQYKTSLSSMNVEQQLISQIIFNKREPHHDLTFLQMRYKKIFATENTKNEIINFLIFRLQDHNLLQLQDFDNHKLIQQEGQQIQMQNKIEKKQKESISLKAQQSLESFSAGEKEQQIGAHQKQLEKQSAYKIQNLKMESSNSIVEEIPQNKIGIARKAGMKSYSMVLLRINSILNRICSQRKHLILTPFAISQFIKKKKSSLPVITRQLIESDKAQETLRTVVNQIQDVIISDILANLQSFRTKEKRHQFLKTLFLHNVFLIAERKLSKESPSVEDFKISINQFQYKMSHSSIDVIIKFLDLNLFSSEKSQNKQINQTKIVIEFPLILLQEKIDNIQDRYLNEMLKHDAYLLCSSIKGNSGRGALVETLLIKAIRNSHTLVIMDKSYYGTTQQTHSEVKYDKNEEIKIQHPQQTSGLKKKSEVSISQYLKQTISAQEFIKFYQRLISDQFFNIDKRHLYFKPIPRATSKEKFSIAESLSYSLHNQHSMTTMLLRPIKKSQLCNMNNDENDDKIDQTSKCIDFCIVKYQPGVFIEGNLIDVTTDKQKEVAKVEKFLRNYELFSDRREKTVTIQKKQCAIAIKYYIFGVNKRQENTPNIAQLCKKLQKGFLNISFTAKQNSILVKSKTENNEILKSINFIEFQQLEFFAQKQKIEEIKIFKKIHQDIQYQIEMKQEEQRKSKHH